MADQDAKWAAEPQGSRIRKGRLVLLLLVLAVIAPFAPRIYRSGLVVSYDHPVTERIFGAADLSDTIFAPYRVNDIVVGAFHMFRRDDSQIHLAFYGRRPPQTARVVRAKLLEPYEAELPVEPAEFRASGEVAGVPLLGGLDNAGWLGPQFTAQLAGRIPGFAVEVTVDIDGTIATFQYRFVDLSYWMPPFPT